MKLFIFSSNIKITKKQTKPNNEENVPTLEMNSHLYKLQEDLW